MEIRQELIKDALDSSGWHGPPLRFLEIGIRHGETWQALNGYFNASNVQYTGVDIKFYLTPPQEGRWIEQDSVDYWRTLPVDQMFHVIFVDGCHGNIHADLDTKGALLHLHPGGILLQHDTGCDSETLHPRIKKAGCFGAFCRNCLDRPELVGRIDRQHPEGMGITKKHSPLGKQFLLDTEDTDTVGCCDVCDTFGLDKKTPGVRKTFPLYFGESDGT